MERKDVLKAVVAAGFMAVTSACGQNKVNNVVVGKEIYSDAGGNVYKLDIDYCNQVNGTKQCQIGGFVVDPRTYYSTSIGDTVDSKILAPQVQITWSTPTK